MKLFIGIFILLLVVSAFMNFGGKKDNFEVVGVGRSEISAKLDLTDKLNPKIIPDVLHQVLVSLPKDDKPNTEKFQQKVVQKFSQAIMDDADVNYRVDLNEDGTIDPLLVIPEDVDKEGAVYSLRVPDPENYPKDPSADANWDKISQNQSLELMEVSVTFDEASNKVNISSQPNQHLYENHGNNSHYTSHYHNPLGSILLYSMLFSPYRWGFGPWYGGYYGSYYRGYPVGSRGPRVASRYRNSGRSSTGLKTSSGKSIKGSRSSSGTAPSKSIKNLKSKRSMAVRKSSSSPNRKGGFGSGSRVGKPSKRTGGFGKSRSRGFGGGGSRGWGK